MNTMRRTTDRRWRLRDATSAAHMDLDQMIGTFSDRASYARYLTALYAFRAPLEPLARPAIPLAALMESDLAALSLPIPRPTPAPPVTGSALLGQLYVLEGAALGGQILRKRAALLGFDADRGASHLAIPVTGWLAFLETLESAPDYDADIAASTAIATFALARDAFLKAAP